MKLRRTACRVDLEGVRQVVFRASGLLVNFRDNPKLGDGILK